jgi:hypothetical protein
MEHRSSNWAIRIGNKGKPVTRETGDRETGDRRNVYLVEGASVHPVIDSLSEPLRRRFEAIGSTTTPKQER